MGGRLKRDDNYHEDLLTNYDRDEDQGNEKVLTQKKVFGKPLSEAFERLDTWNSIVDDNDLVYWHKNDLPRDFSSVFLIKSNFWKNKKT